VGYGLGVSASALILVFILLKKWNKKELKRRSKQLTLTLTSSNGPEQVALTLTSSNGPVEADGDMNEFRITIENRYTYLVKDGVIVAYKDSYKSNTFKEYVEVN
jgi:hypothetical protein